MTLNDQSSTQIDPPSFDANNNDLLVWSLFLLDGAEKWVDVENIYLKAFELGPARLSWRTRADIPDYKKVSKALQSVEASGNRWHQPQIRIGPQPSNSSITLQLFLVFLTNIYFLAILVIHNLPGQCIGCSDARTHFQLQN